MERCLPHSIYEDFDTSPFFHLPLLLRFLKQLSKPQCHFGPAYLRPLEQFLFFVDYISDSSPRGYTESSLFRLLLYVSLASRPCSPV